jgi:3-hydroxyisobutyrate dehydrogenase
MTENYAFIGTIAIPLRCPLTDRYPGIGAMGYAMASNIRKKAPPSSILYINDITQAACEKFKSEYSSYGPIEIVPTAREAAENSKVVISIVPGASDVKKVYLDETDGVISSKPDPDRVLCECSTIDVKSTREVGEALKARGRGTYVDTPVSVSTLRNSQYLPLIIFIRAAYLQLNAAT